MNNGDMPAGTTSLEISERYESGYYDQAALGLTKREVFAMAAMQGWLARCANVPHTIELNPESMASVAVSMADALLKELEK